MPHDAIGLGRGGGDGGRVFPDHPGPILHLLRDHISRKGQPSLRCSICSPLRGIGQFNREFNNNYDFDIFQFIYDKSLNAEKSIINDQIVSDLQKIILELPDDQKEVLMMRFYRDMSFKEISESTGVSINTALGRMRYALINLRKVIQTNNISLNQ